MEHTLSVFVPEMSLHADFPKSRDQMTLECGLRRSEDNDSKPLLLSDGEAERAVVAAVVLQPLRVEPDSVRADSVEKVLWGWVARSPKKGASHVGTYIYIYIHIYIYIYIYTYICANCTRALEA